MAENWHKFAAIAVGDPFLHESTNVGVIVFNADGTYFGHKIGSLDRARRRGDLPGIMTADRLDSFARSFPTTDIVDRWRDSTGAAMGTAWIGGWGCGIHPPSQLLAETFVRLVRED